MKLVKDYQDLYLKYDFLLLAGVSEIFGNNSLKCYELCLTLCLSAPALSWDAMFNKTKIKLELVSDADMYLFFENVLRVSYISKRHSKASNKCL